MEISKANGGKRREHEVNDDPQVFEVGQVLQPVLIVESELVFCMRRMLRQDEPQSAQKVSQDQDEGDDAGDLKAFDDEWEAVDE